MRFPRRARERGEGLGHQLSPSEALEFLAGGASRLEHPAQGRQSGTHPAVARREYENSSRSGAREDIDRWVGGMEDGGSWAVCWSTRTEVPGTPEWVSDPLAESRIADKSLPESRNRPGDFQS